MSCNFLSDLLPEIVLHITGYLEVPDVFRCIRVCKAWHDMLCFGEMTMFWRRACVYAGLPASYVKERLSGSSKFPSELFQDIRQHKAIVAAQKPEIHPIGGTHPFDSTQKCEYAGDGFFVKTIDYSTLKNEETVIGEFCSDQRSIVKRDGLQSDCGEVLWARHIAGNIIYQTAKGKWYRYNVADRQFIELTFGTQDKGQHYTIGYCRHCLFLVFTSIENAMHSYSWILYFLNFSDGRDNKPLELRRKTPIPSGTTQYIPRPTRGHLLPMKCGDCSQGHRLIVQGGSGACVYNVTHSNEDGIQISPQPVGKLNPFFDIHIAVMVVNTTSEMTLSADEKVLGLITCIVYPFQSGLCLHLFDTKTYERLSSVKLDWKEGFNEGCVLAVNRLYAVLAVSHSDGCIKLMHTRTGELLLEVNNLKHGLPPIVPMSRLILIHYQGTYGEEDMIDVTNPLNLVIVYRQGIKSLQGVWFSPSPMDPAIDSAVNVASGEESDDD